MKHLHRISFLYLIIPFIIFLFGWLRLTVALPVVVIIIWAIWQLLKQAPFNQFPIPNSRTTFYLLLISGLWVFLSGVGGYAFQNWDHHWRNAVFHDLINYDWPVFYSTPETGPIKMLVYYVGYWLPVALAGKLLGWKFANFILFLWTWLGVYLVTLHLSLKLKISPLKTILLIIFFSGLDALGTLILSPEYPTLFPPIQHLEIWPSDIQYSSFTTQLFWVFNQAIPAWLCLALFVILSDPFVGDRRISHIDNETLRSQDTLPHIVPMPVWESDTRGKLIFIWSLCFFFAPLAAIGLLPYLLIEIFKQTDFKSPFKNIDLGLLLAAGVIFLVSSFFFSSNTAAQERGFQFIALKDIFLFFLLEGGILWLLLAPLKWRDPRWAITGPLLFLIPFIQLGSGRDFVMRASIAPLFYLMIMVGETLFQKTAPHVLRITLYALLLLGAITPLYEINRSIYRTYEYYFVLDEDQRLTTPPVPATHLEQAGALEYEHPNSLVADEILTLQFMDDKLSKNFIANVRQSLYYRYLSPR